MNTFIFDLSHSRMWSLVNVIETNFKTENSVKTFFIKKIIDQIRFVFRKEHERTLIPKEIKNITYFLLLTL